MNAVTHRRSRVLICDAIAEPGIDMLREHFDVDVKTGLAEDELCDIVGQYEAVVVRSATKITGKVIASADRLRVIARAGAGLDTIDVPAAVKRDIQVINAPDANTVAVAELAMGMVLSLARNIATADASMKDGKWEKKQLIGMGLVGKTLGMVGFGRIGKAVAARARAFGMEVLAYQRHPSPEMYLAAGVEPVELMELLDRRSLAAKQKLTIPFLRQSLSAITSGSGAETGSASETGSGSSSSSGSS